MKIFIVSTLLTTSFLLSFVTLRLERQKISRQQTVSQKRLEILNDQLHQIQLDIHQELADPTLQIALEDLGYQRNFKKTRRMARRLLEDPDEGARAQKNQQPKKDSSAW